MYLDVLMPFKFSVWSSRAGDKLDISDRVIIWRAGLIRGRVAATYSHSPRSGVEESTTNIVITNTTNINLSYTEIVVKLRRFEFLPRM